MNYPVFVVSAPGMEDITAREIAELDLARGGTAQTVPGGVEFSGDLETVYRANLLLRTASRVLARLSTFYATDFSELRTKASRLPWERYLRPGQPVSIRATCRESKLYHSDAVIERVLGAIKDRLSASVTLCAATDDAVADGGEADRPAQVVVVRLFKNRCTVSVDSSGALLHRRGYRLATAKAPLRETLAAGLVLASGWDGRTPLLDPFCGSGTIPIEAALWTRNIAPGKARNFAFMAWPDFTPDVWESTLAAAIAAERPDAPLLLASDRDAGAIRAAEANAARAGVINDIAFTCRAVSAIAPPPEPGWVVTNLPYGVRVSKNKDLRNLYAQFGNVLRAQCPGWRVTFLCSDLLLIGQTRLPVETTRVWTNGGLRVRVAQGAVPR
ncbi:MAG TPA: class I SAM-dependent RNA methyltransferase [Anaerolineae bacterium]|nr:class I SAM-dependent RNA methyltransferase [Anaerolineae bacterium]HQH38667.1 class I SAM-dependent RNA methyltransferase [Anaerolineae bacterium]